MVQYILCMEIKIFILDHLQELQQQEIIINVSDIGRMLILSVVEMIIYIGQACRTSNATITNSINIGSNVVATNSNEIVIGNTSNDNLKIANANAFFTGKFRTSGGTSSEFLKANGTTDSEAYLPLY